MSDASGWVWEEVSNRQPRTGPQETREYLKAGKGFAIVRVEHRVLMSLRKPSGQSLLSTALQSVLLCVLSHVNWSPDEQGGYPACWPGIKTIARETGLSENTVTKHLAALSDGPYIERSRNGEVRYPGLLIIRKAEPDEAAKVREHLGAVGRPTTVLILCHPRDWRLPAFAREEFDTRLVLLRSPAREARNTHSGRWNGGRSTGHGGDLDGGKR